MSIARVKATVGRAGLALALALVGCMPAAPAPPPAPPSPPLPPPPPGPDTRGCPAEFGGPASLALDRAAFQAGGADAKSLAKLDASAHRYSRLLARQMAARTCQAFRDVRYHLPVVAIHGDAHLEQFAVTPSTFGIEDFDEAGFGPFVVDLVRMATSIQLACREVKWACQPDDAVSAFFRAYRGAIDKPPTRSLPAVATRMRERIPHDTAAWLTWTESLGQPLSAEKLASTKARWSEYVDSLSEAERGPSRAFYDIVRVGDLKIGVGSGLETKLLFRVRGPTDSPADDVVLEGRGTALKPESSCVYQPVYGGALYLLTMIAVLGPRMPHAFGTVLLDETPGAHEFWLQTWEPGYGELSLSDIHSQAELEELVSDGARQLAGYFWTRFPDTLRMHQRLAGLVGFDLVDLRAKALAKDLAAETLAGWEAFRRVK